MAILNEIRFDNLRGDLFGGVTAAIIALPMALAFGVASGAGPAAGLYGAVLVGLFAALFGSTPTLISEPTGPMTVIMTAVIAQLLAANPEQGMAMAFTVVMLAGVFQMLFGALKLGHYVTMMPYTVISGFMTGIGIILIVLQLGPFLGQAPPPGGVTGTLSSLPQMIADIRPEETMLALLSFGLLVSVPEKVQPHGSAATPRPGAWHAGFGDLAVRREIRRIGEIPTGLPQLQLPVFTAAQWQLMVVEAAVLAVLGSIDALLTSVIAENLTRKESDSNKELFGQGRGQSRLRPVWWHTRCRRHDGHGGQHPDRWTLRTVGPDAGHTAADRGAVGGRPDRTDTARRARRHRAQGRDRYHRLVVSEARTPGVLQGRL